MSTRCQVKVVQEGLQWDQSLTLYHHTDGYPEYMVPLIARAYKLYGKSWEAGRAGKVASFLCAVDPGVFEPEEGHTLHGDIEYYYILHVMNGECCGWEIEIKIPERHYHWAVEDLLHTSLERTEILKAAKKYTKGPKPTPEFRFTAEYIILITSEDFDEIILGTHLKGSPQRFEVRIKVPTNQGENLCAVNFPDVPIKIQAA